MHCLIQKSFIQKKNRCSVLCCQRTLAFLLRVRNKCRATPTNEMNVRPPIFFVFFLPLTGSATKASFLDLIYSNLSAFFHDVWRYRMNDSAWAWMSGSTTPYSKGFRGPSRGEIYPPSVIPARWDSAGWYNQSSGEMWIFGGSTEVV